MTQKLTCLKPLVLAALLGGASVAHGDTFVYDALGRIKTATYANGTVENFIYDAAGNRVGSGPNPGMPAAVAFTLATSSGLSSTFNNPNSFAVQPTATGQIINGNGAGYTGTSSNTCVGSVPGGGTCTIVIFAALPSCRTGSYATQAYVKVGTTTTTGANVPRPCSN